VISVVKVHRSKEQRSIQHVKEKNVVISAVKVYRFKVQKGPTKKLQIMQLREKRSSTTCRYKVQERKEVLMHVIIILNYLKLYLKL